MSQFAQLFNAVKNESKEKPQKPQKIKTAKESSAKKPNDVNVKSAQLEKPDSPSLDIKNTKGRLAQRDDAPPLETKRSMPEKTKQVAKSRNADYTQVLTYIRRSTHKGIKKVLIDDPQNRDLSDLVEELLSGWLNRMYND